MPRGRPKEFVREEALARALEAFWLKGYTATGISDLTAAMGIGRQSLYDTFGDKKALFLEALEAYCNEQFLQMEALLTSTQGTAGGRLAAFFDAWPSMLTGENVRGCLLMKSVGDCAGSSDPEILAAASAQMDRVDELIAHCIQAAIDTGEITCGLPKESILATCRAAVHGLSMRAQIEDNHDEIVAVSAGLKTMLGLGAEAMTAEISPPAQAAESPTKDSCAVARGIKNMLGLGQKAEPRRVDSWKRPRTSG